MLTTCLENVNSHLDKEYKGVSTVSDLRFHQFLAVANTVKVVAMWTLLGFADYLFATGFYEYFSTKDITVGLDNMLNTIMMAVAVCAVVTLNVAVIVTGATFVVCQGYRIHYLNNEINQKKQGYDSLNAL